MTLINFIHLSVSLISAYSILTETYFLPCSNLVGALLYMDYILHYLQLKVLKTDILLHHFFGLCAIHFVYNHREFLSYENKEIIEFFQNVLSIEIPNIFLALMYLLKNDNVATSIQQINNVVFVSSFCYVRIYRYTRYVVLSKEVYHIVVILSKNLIHRYSMLIGIYGLGILNIYWFYIIVQKVGSLIHSEKKTSLEAK
jgi:hypothetical protein